MDYKNYQRTRDAAWRILRDCGIDRLPVNLNAICASLGIHARSYTDVRDWIGRLPRQCNDADGIIYFRHGEPVLLYDDTTTDGRARFTIAHEIGHLVLGHVDGGLPLHRSNLGSVDPRERAANQFAARLLAPACVLWGLDLHAPEEIAVACNISITAAAFRAERMEELYRRGRFLSYPLEREVYDRFTDYIKAASSCRRANPDQADHP